MLDAMTELARSIKRVSVQFPTDLHAALVRLAERDQRSLHGEILWLLRRAVEQEA